MDVYFILSLTIGVLIYPGRLDKTSFSGLLLPCGSWSMLWAVKR